MKTNMTLTDPYISVIAGLQISSFDSSCNSLKEIHKETTS